MVVFLQICNNISMIGFNPLVSLPLPFSPSYFLSFSFSLPPFLSSSLLTLTKNPFGFLSSLSNKGTILLNLLTDTHFNYISFVIGSKYVYW